MGSVTTPPVEQARSIFDNLGYTISTQGSDTEFRAERDWKVVKVTPISDPEETPRGEPGEYRCFVTHRQAESALRRYLRRSNPEYEWAIITVHDGDGEGEGDGNGSAGNYDVVRAPPPLV